MRTLYESILDDEDVLIDDVKKSSNDPIEVFIAAIDSDMGRGDISKMLNGGLFNNFIKEELKLDPNDYFWMVHTYNHNIASAGLCSKKDNNFYPLIIRYVRKKSFCIEFKQFSIYGEMRDITSYDQYKKTLGCFRKRGFKKSNAPIDRMGSYNVYVKKL